jgi:hypothetical protein
LDFSLEVTKLLQLLQLRLVLQLQRQPKERAKGVILPQFNHLLRRQRHLLQELCSQHLKELRMALVPVKERALAKAKVKAPVPVQLEDLVEKVAVKVETALLYLVLALWLARGQKLARITRPVVTVYLDSVKALEKALEKEGRIALDFYFPFRILQRGLQIIPEQRSPRSLTVVVPHLGSAKVWTSDARINNSY